MGVTAAVAAIAGAGYTVYSGEQQQKEAKKAQEAQKQSLLAVKQDEDSKLAKRRADMKLAQKGRGSLLSGTEKGVEQTPMQTTLG